MKRGHKRIFADIRNSILVCLLDGEKTINQISNITNTNWKTVSHHLIYLVGKGYAREVFNSAYVRIFEITALGNDYLRNLKYKELRLDIVEIRTSDKT